MRFDDFEPPPRDADAPPQMRLTAVWLNPQRWAIVRVLQCVASRGMLSSVSRTTRSTSASMIFRGAPGLARGGAQRGHYWGRKPMRGLGSDH